jgi:hypothetical protein
MQHTNNSLSTTASTMNVQPRSSFIRLSPSAVACGMLCLSLASAVSAQSYEPVKPVPINAAQTSAPEVLRGTIDGVDYSANSSVASITVELEKNGLPADGLTTNQVTVRLFDKTGAPLKGDVTVTIENSAGRVLIDGAKTDELGPGRLDADKVTPGTQLKVSNGVGSFKLLAPLEPTDLKMRITAGTAVAEGTVSYLPELRDMVAAGLIEGIISLSKKSDAQITPTRINDGFERELNRWTKEFNDGKGTYGARTAFFLKGTIRGDMLLTAAFDSDKDTQERLQRDVDPNRFYPVYGDASLTGFDARSSDRLYVRLDSGKNYALWGDFSTGDGFSQLTGGGSVANVSSRNLGAYSRSATGLRGHLENSRYLLNGFAFDDNLKQLVEEYRANGTSGPYSVSNFSGVENSEKVEIITRDKNALGVVKQVELKQRLLDYSFEPFSGRILFKAPIASINANGDPQSVRITYEVEQGGPKFTTAGVDGQFKLTEGIELGAAFVDDKNPVSPYQLGSVNATVRLGKSAAVSMEWATSKSTRYLGGTAVTATPSGAAGEARDDRKGNAYRIEGAYDQGGLSSRAWFMRGERNFYNPEASVSEGKEEAGFNANYKLSDAFSVYGTVQHNQDRVPPGNPARNAQALGGIWNATDKLTLDASLRHATENQGYGGSATISSNSTDGGGFFGLGTDAVNPTTGITILGTGNGNAVAGAGLNPQRQKSTSLRLAADYKATDRWSVNGEVELGNNSQRRWGAGTAYQINERSKLYGRFEQRTGLTSAAALSTEDRSTSLVAGIDNTFASGPTVYSEYRLRDAISSNTALARDQQLASGVRNTWNYAQGLTFTGGAEYLKIYNGKARDAFAVNAGVDYSASPLWRSSGRVEVRRVLNDKATAINDTQDQYLSTLSVARKIDRDWTLLGRNYLLYQNNHDSVANLGLNGKKLEDRFQVGAAWRPVDHNRWNTLARYEYKTVNDKTIAEGENYRAHIISLHGDYHPSRPWFFNSRFAAKSVNDKALPQGQQGYTAWLVGGRLTYDITENWDVGVMTSYMRDAYGAQWAQGAELGYLVQQNLWLSAGANWRGFNSRSKDLTGAEYTNKGVYLRLRFKFDASLFQGKDTNVNRALDR